VRYRLFPITVKCIKAREALKQSFFNRWELIYVLMWDEGSVCELCRIRGRLQAFCLSTDFFEKIVSMRIYCYYQWAELFNFKDP